MSRSDTPQRNQKRYASMIKKYGDVSLYNSLHHVGDDPVKDVIEKDLEELLDDESLKVVRAVFAFHTQD